MRNLYRYRDLIWELVKRDLKVRYRRSAIGLVWTMLQPLLMMSVLAIVFQHIFTIRDLRLLEHGNYPVYALAGLLFWNFFQQSIVASMNSLKGNAHILRKLPVPLAVFPVATVISGVVNLVLAFVPMMAILIMTGHKIGPQLAFLPVSILLVALFTLGAGLLLSPMAVFFSDVVELVGVFLTMLFYLTPVIYPKKILDGTQFDWLIHFNPTRSILEVFRDPIYLNKIPPLSHLSLSFALAVGAMAIGAFVFRRSMARVPFYL